MLVVDCTRGMEIQDYRIITEIRKAGKGLIVVLNKWDILPNKNDKSFDHMIRDLLEREPMLEFVPILSISAKEGQRVGRVIQAIQTVYANCRRVLGRDRVAESFANFLQEKAPPSHNVLFEISHTTIRVSRRTAESPADNSTFPVQRVYAAGELRNFGKFVDKARRTVCVEKFRLVGDGDVCAAELHRLETFDGFGNIFRFWSVGEIRRIDAESTK